MAPDQMQKRLEQLRGSLPIEGPGARGIERMARNHRCDRLRALTYAGVSPTTAARRIYSEPRRDGSSPFAIKQGNRFEADLFCDGAQKLVELYLKHGRLRLKTLTVAVEGPSPDSVKARVGNKSISATLATADHLARIELPQEVTLEDGQSIEVEIL